MFMYCSVSNEFHLKSKIRKRITVHLNYHVYQTYMTPLQRTKPRYPWDRPMPLLYTVLVIFFQKTITCSKGAELPVKRLDIEVILT